MNDDHANKAKVSRKTKRQVRKVLAEAERRGLLERTGQMRNGQIVYRSTDAGRAWADAVHHGASGWPQ